MKYLYIAIVALLLLPAGTFAQSDGDKSDELKELKEEIKALKKDMKSNSDEEAEETKEDQDAQMDALKQELDALKAEASDDKEKMKEEKEEMKQMSDDKQDEIKYTYAIPDQQVFADEKAMSLGVEPCYVLVVQNIKSKDLKNRWKDYMKQYDSKPKKVKGSKHEQKCEAVTIYDLGYDKFNVHSTTYDNGSSQEMVVWFNNGERFIADSDKIKAFMIDFGVFIEKYNVDEEMEEEEKILKKHTERQEKLVKEKSKLEDNITKWEREIREAKSKIERNIVDQENNVVEIENQEKVVKVVKNKLSHF